MMLGGDAVVYQKLCLVCTGTRGYKMPRSRPWMIGDNTIGASCGGIVINRRSDASDV
jgi:hypothetical protein